MPTHADDSIFIIWAYAGVVVATLALIAVSWWQSRRVKAQIAALEARGIRRRSDA
jgi:heme export protein D (CcmD)